MVGVFVLLLASFVLGALRRQTLASAAVTPPHPVAVGDTLVGPAVYTVDATDQDRWAFFDFSRNSVVTDPGPLDWDLAFRRFQIIANGGPGFAGQGGVEDVGEVPLDSVREAPAAGYQPTGRDSTNPGVGKWYRYGYSSHLLEPKRHTWAVRTADGKYAAFEIVTYYCEGARSGCLTFRYVYQGGGGQRLAGTPDRRGQ